MAGFLATSRVIRLPIANKGESGIKYGLYQRITAAGTAPEFHRIPF